LVTLNSGLPSSRSSGAVFEVEIQTLRTSGPREDPIAVLFVLPFVFGCQSASPGGLHCAAPGRDASSRRLQGWWS